MRSIILASASPRRNDLLRHLLGDSFTVEASGFDESGPLPADPILHVLASSLGKARDVAERLGKLEIADTADSHRPKADPIIIGAGLIIIGADTIVVLGGAILGKPHTPERATEMLGMISGRVVEVITGITVINRENVCGVEEGCGELQTHELTKVFMKELDEQTIRDYVVTGEPLDKAGAFGIQGEGGALVDRIEGDYFNVVGLPLVALAELLRQAGVEVNEPLPIAEHH